MVVLHGVPEKAAVDILIPSMGSEMAKKTVMCYTMVTWQGGLTSPSQESHLAA